MKVKPLTENAAMEDDTHAVYEGELAFAVSELGQLPRAVST